MGASKGVRDRIFQYFARSGRLSNRMVEYESAIHTEPLRVKGTRCRAKDSTGDNVIVDCAERQSCTAGQMWDKSSV